MRVKLKIVSGSNAGKVVRINKEKFLIGRSQSCHLRPASETISRKHCALITEGETISIEDLKSRNGVLVNGEKITEIRLLASGDHLKIGKLEFEVVIKDVQEQAKAQTVTGVDDTLPSISDSGSIEDSISGWLFDGDELNRLQQKASPKDTRQFKLDETDQVRLDEESQLETEALKVESSSDTDIAKKDGKEKKKKKKPGKLPPMPNQAGKDSREAAEGTLKKLFERR